MKTRYLIFFLVAIAYWLLPAPANAQKTCARVTPTSQNCTATIDWTASVVDATHDAPVSYSIRRADGVGAKTQIGTVNVPIVTLQNVFTDAGGIAHCWDVIAVNTGGASAPSTQSCWTTPAIVPVAANPPTNLIVR